MSNDTPGPVDSAPTIDPDGTPGTCRLVHVVVARARDLARCWDALADRAEVAP